VHVGIKIVNNLATYPEYRTDIANERDIFEEYVKTLKVNEIDEQPIDISGDVIHPYGEFMFASNL
jgi:phenylalanyl-tRNA synthetase beta subunit